MATSITNYAITAGGVAQTMIPERLGRSRLIIEPITEDLWVRWGGAAAVDAGEKIVNGQSASYTVEGFPEIGGGVSFFSATTGAKIVVREA